jgi:hypothetical protein
MWTITYEKTNLVSRHRGTLPVILSCPHDGKEVPRGVSKRTGANPDCPPFKTSRDLHTREITQGIAQRLLDVFGEAPYVVIAEFHGSTSMQIAHRAVPLKLLELSPSMTNTTILSAASSTRSAPKMATWVFSSISTGRV